MLSASYINCTHSKILTVMEFNIWLYKLHKIISKTITVIQASIDDLFTLCKWTGTSFRGYYVDMYKQTSILISNLYTHFLNYCEIDCVWFLCACFTWCAGCSHAHGNGTWWWLSTRQHYSRYQNTIQSKCRVAWHTTILFVVFDV